MLPKVIKNSQDIDPELSAEEVADAIWLARYIGATPGKSSEKTASVAKDSTGSQDDNHKQSGDDDNRTDSSATSQVHSVATQKSREDRWQLGALPFRSPTARALPGSLSLANSLRPFMRRVPDYTRIVLNEEATAEHIAETDVWFPVLDYALTRWFDVSLVVDIGASMNVWRQTIAEFYLLLSRRGAFRDVRMWEIDTNAADKVYLYAGTDARRQARDRRELIDTGKQRLILVVTDCVAPAWYSSSMAEVLAQWGQYNVVTLVQVLPQPLWPRTALRTATEVRVKALSPGVANKEFIVQAVSSWEDDVLAVPAVAGTNKGELILPVPIVTLEPEALAGWSKVIARPTDSWIPAYRFATRLQQSAIATHQQSNNVVAATSSMQISAETRVKLFYENSSSIARKLAEMLAITPVSMPVARLIQQTLLPEIRTHHIAEVFLGGLLEVISDHDVLLDADDIQYDFVEGVRAVLLNRVLLKDAVRVLSEISDFVANKYGQSLDFRALLTVPGTHEKLSVNEESRPFALLGAEALHRFGGRYALLAKELSEAINNPNKPVDTSDKLHKAPIRPSTSHPDAVMKMQRRRIVKSICPLCFEEVYHGNCRIVSGSAPGAILKEAPVGSLERRLARLNPERLDSPQYQAANARFECPQCGYLLPANVESVPNKPLAVVGNFFAGKSHYIAAFLYQLKGDWAVATNETIQLQCLTPEVEEKYRNDYLNRLFEEKKDLGPTQPARTTVEPLIYELSVHRPTQSTLQAVNLIIYDASGEDFRPERLGRFAAFVFNAGAFIFVTDPILIPAVFRQLPPSIRNSLSARLLAERRAGEVLNDTIDQLERYHGYPAGASLDDTPVAVMISKSDLFKHFNPPYAYSFMSNPQYSNTLDLQDVNRIDQEVKDVLVKYKQGDLLALTKRFKRVKFFATSATGQPPDAQGNFSEVKPCRCLDPVLWILYEFGLIGAHP